MTVDFDSLMARQSVADIRTSVIAACETVGFYVSRLPGLSRLRKLALDVVPVIVELATDINTDAIRGGLLDYAEDAWLELLALNLFGVPKIKLTFATTNVRFTNTQAGSYNFADGEMVVSNGFVTYSASAFALSPAGSDGDTATVSVTCTVAGSSGSTAANTITSIVTQYDGVTVTNPAAVFGTDEETDEQLRERCRLSRSALSNAGPVAAIEFVARSATRTDGSAIGITRAQVVENSPSMGDVAVYLADADGEVDSDDVDRIDDLLRTLVVPTGVNFIDTYAATTVVVAVTHTSRYKASVGFSQSELATMVEAALAEMFASHPIGGYVETGPNGVMYRRELEATIACIQGEESTERPIKSATVSLPAGDVTLTPGQVAVLGVVTHNWIAV
jgi:phage-related baseplate assembly protein